MAQNSGRNGIAISRKESIQNLVSSMVFSGVSFGMAYLMKTELFRILLCIPGVFFGLFVIIWTGIVIRIFSEKGRRDGLQGTEPVTESVAEDTRGKASVTEVQVEGGETAELEDAGSGSSASARHRTYSPLCPKEPEGQEEDGGS